MNEFEPVKDSSIWVDPAQRTALNRMDSMIRIGIVKAAFNDADTGELRYLVETQSHGQKINMNCRLMRRFGGVFNFEDYIYQGYTTTGTPDPVAAFNAKAGDAVIVGQLNGQGREGVILGGFTHAARTTTLQASGGPQYQSVFNGLQTSINKDGEWTITFQGQPTNLNLLSKTPSVAIPAPTYNTSIGSSFMKFDKTGSWTLSDNATSNPQSIFMDKASGAITATSGAVSLKLNKGDQSTTLTCQVLNINSSNTITETTGDYSLTASSTAKFKSPKVAIGTESIELLDQLTQLIMNLGLVTPISPIGPCTPLAATPQWAQVQEIMTKLTQIKGTF